MRTEVKWRWARNGAIIGVLVIASDVFLEWRGPSPLEPWTEDGFVFNFGYILTSVLLPAAIGLAAGYWWSNRRRGL